MQKTAEQIADAVLEKIAVSPGLATAALASRASRGGRGIPDIMSLLGKYPRTAQRASEARAGLEHIKELASSLKNQSGLLAHGGLSLDDIVRTQNSTFPR